MLYHIPNEGKRSRVTGARLVAEGLKRGVPDICLPVARGGCHGLYIELKRERSGRPTAEQTEWMDALMRQGYAVSLCHGWERAAGVIEEYLEGERPWKKSGRNEQWAIKRKSTGVIRHGTP